LSRARRSLVLTTLALAVWATAELMAGVALWVVGGQVPLPNRLREMRREALSAAPPAVAAGLQLPDQGGPEGSARRRFPQEALHPFLGFVLDPATASGGVMVSPQGFFRVQSKEARRSSAGGYTVGIFGGSVATGFCFGSRETFIDRLQRAGVTGGRPVVVECLALGGYKQPQSLMALHWLLAQGQAFDLVLNLDGFNDIVLPAVENAAHRIHPFYPRSWPVLTNAVMTADTLRRVGEIEYLRGERRLGAQSCVRGPLAWSPLCHLLWSNRDRRLAARISALAAQGKAEPPKASQFTASGPKFGKLPAAKLYVELARFWAESSMLMHQTCVARGIPYFHFLQPNQYVAGAKPMGAAERAVATRADQPYRRSVELGYPELKAAGKRLASSGVPFFDLTRVFAEHPGPLYQDDCCHYNQLGNEIVGAAVGEIVVEALGPMAGSQVR
jgi:hypothetical protein